MFLGKRGVQCRESEIEQNSKKVLREDFAKLYDALTDFLPDEDGVELLNNPEKYTSKEVWAVRVRIHGCVEEKGGFDAVENIGLLMHRFAGTMRTLCKVYGEERDKVCGEVFEKESELIEKVRWWRKCGESWAEVEMNEKGGDIFVTGWGYPGSYVVNERSFWVLYRRVWHSFGRIYE